MREHNRLAEKFADWYKKKGFDDDIIDKLAYEEARRIVAAEMQVDSSLSMNRPDGEYPRRVKRPHQF